LLVPGGDVTVRGTALDALFIGLWLDGAHGKDLKEAGFDGAYSYFASEGFSYGSSVAHWKTMVTFCNAYGLLSSLSVGPGYDDSAIRPWNRHNSKFREDGRYYEGMWEEALAAKPTFVSITSYNEWGEGTQIEPAREVIKSEGFEKSYAHYGKGGPQLYITITGRYAAKYREQAMRQRQMYEKEL
jgi:glycoprotein endo-alpha-1,2-mannosidase